jgi:hypothetical protein
MSAAFTLKLLSLECIQAQEFEGDEPYLTLNDVRVWEVGRNEHMHQFPKQPNTYSAVDFASGRKLTRLGWENMQSFNPAHYIFEKRTGELVLSLWEADRLNADDHIASTPITLADSKGGTITAMLNGDGASYRLTYRVEAE